MHWAFTIRQRLCGAVATREVIGLLKNRVKLQATHDHFPRWGFSFPFLKSALDTPAEPHQSCMAEKL